MNNTVIVTGGAGFIGSAVIRHLLQHCDCDVVNVDKLTYAGNEATISGFVENSRYAFEKCDICDRAAITDVFGRYQPRAIMHLAAESHVDRSIDGPWEWIAEASIPIGLQTSPSGKHKKKKHRGRGY